LFFRSLWLPFRYAGGGGRVRPLARGPARNSDSIVNLLFFRDNPLVSADRSAYVQ